MLAYFEESSGLVPLELNDAFVNVVQSKTRTLRAA